MSAQETQPVVSVYHDGTVFTEVETDVLPELLVQIEDYIEEREAALQSARIEADNIRNELARRMDAEGARFLKAGQYVAKFVETPARALVRTDIIAADPAFMEEARAVVPAAILEKAIAFKPIPATVETKTNLVYLKKFLECGEAGIRLFNRIVDRGQPRRRLVIEREQTRVTQESEACL